MFVFLRHTYSEPRFSLGVGRYTVSAAGTARRVKKVRGTSYRPRRAPRRGALRAARTAAAAARARPRSARHDRRGFLKPGRPTAVRLFSASCSPGLGFGLSVSRSLGLHFLLEFTRTTHARASERERFVSSKGVRGGRSTSSTNRTNRSVALLQTKRADRPGFSLVRQAHAAAPPPLPATAVSPSPPPPH